MVRPRLLSLVSAAWFLLLIVAFHFGPEKFPAGELALLVLDAVLLGLLAASAWGWGALLLAPLRLGDQSPREAPLLEIGAGLGGLALFVFATAAAGMLHRLVVVSVMAAGVLLLRRVDIRATWPRATPLPPWSRSEALLAIPLAAAGAVTLACSLAPPEFYDALLYHLAVPDLYIRHGAMVPVEGNYYASYPANMGMLYAIGLLLHGGQLAQSIHWLGGALAALALYQAACRHLDRTTALLACLLFALTPGVMLASTYAIADLGATVFGMLAFAAVLNLWREEDRRWAIAAGVFAGLALGTKYTAALVVCIPAAAAIWWRPGGVRGVGGTHGMRGMHHKDLLLFGAIVVLLVMPWLGRNFLLTGNPVAPYLSSGIASTGDGSPGILDEMGRRVPAGAGPAGWAMHAIASPWNVSLRRLGAAGYLGPVLLMLVPLLLLMRGLPAVVFPLALMAGIGFGGWAVTSQVTRYLFPALPLIALLAACSARRLPKWLSVPALSWCLLYGLFLFGFLIETIGSLRVAVGAEGREEYLTRRVSYYAAATYLDTLPDTAKVLFIGEGRGFYCPREYVASTPFDIPAHERLARGGGEEQLLEALRAERITHLLVSGPELRRTQGTDADEMMRRLFPSGSPRLLFEQSGVRVYELPGGVGTGYDLNREGKSSPISLSG